jgi:hydantoinase/carbamoylase family amidase
MALQPQRTVSDLKELRALTATEDGAQRVAWTETWAKGREWFKGKLAELPVTIDTDEAGNIWATLKGESDKALIMGSHLDSVYNGGWLDGCYGVISGLEVLRRIASEGKPGVTVSLVDWADEEGARFGRSLFGSGAVAGSLKPDEVRDLRDREGNRLEDVVAKYGVNLNHAKEAGKHLKNVAACLEIHIEQGPVLESKDLPLGVVKGACGRECNGITFIGQSVHSGFTSMELRRDALAAASRFNLEIREIGLRNKGLCTMGKVVTTPNIITVLNGTVYVTLDQRHFESDLLAKMLQEAKDASYRIADEEKVNVEWSHLFRIAPTRFHPELIEFAAQAVEKAGCKAFQLPSGPLHDAAEICIAGVPTTMLFVQTLRGLSHIKEEDAKEEHLILGVQAFDDLARRTMNWITKK